MSEAWGTPSDSALLIAGPSEEAPEDEYLITWVVDFISSELGVDITPGVYELFGSVDVDIEGKPTEFYNDGTFE